MQMEPDAEFDDARFAGVDRQHTRIYALVKEFNNAVYDGAERERLLIILEEIVERAQAHFAAEESLLLEIEHPSYRFQRSTHQLIVDELQLFHRLLVSTPRLARQQCVHAMDSLLVHHIRDEPALYARHRGQWEMPAAYCRAA